MRYRNFLYNIFIAAVGFLFGALVAGGGILKTVDLFWISVLAAFLFAPFRTAVVWAVAGGLAQELLSAYPPFVYGTAMAINIIIIRAFIVNRLSEKTLFGIILLGVIGIAGFELILQLLAYTSREFGSVWVPAIDYTYGKFLLRRILGGAAVLSAVFLLFRHYSPRLRGIIISYSSYNGRYD